MSLCGRRAALLFAILAGAPGLFAATLVGRIYSDKGPPVGNIPISVQPTVAGASGLTAYGAVTDTAGKFTLTVPGGATYSICAENAQVHLLNSCEWSLQQSLVVIPAQAASIQALITLKSGVVLRFRLSDPSALLPSPASTAVKLSVNTSTGVGTGSTTTASAATPTVQFGLFDSGGYYHSIRETSGDELGHNFEILVPPAANFKLAVSAANLQVTDSTGAPVGPAKSISSSGANLMQTQVFTAAVPPTTPAVP